MAIISEEGIAISKRFFEAIETLKAQKKIRGLQTFTRNNNLHRWNVNCVKFYPDKQDVSSAFGNFIVSTANIQKCALYFFQFCSKFPEHINSRVKRRILPVLRDHLDHCLYMTFAVYYFDAFVQD